jgi:mRNA interferase MazF
MKEKQEKDFDRWNRIKKKTNAEQPRLYTVREIWWCRLGVNIGTEQDGNGEFFLRPAIILLGFGPGACLIVPLTTSIREHPLRISVGAVDGRPARANISQVRIIDTRRLVEKIGFLEKETFMILRKTAKDLL